MKNYIQIGDIVNYVPDKDIEPGEIVVINQNNPLIGLAITSIPANTEGGLSLKGVYEFSAVEADEGIIGDPVYWNAAKQNMTIEPSGNVYAGVLFDNKINGGQTVRVRLNERIHQ